MKEQFVAKRIVNIGLIFLVAIGVSVIAGMMGRMYLDQLLGMGALTVLFMVVCYSYSDLSFPAGVYKSGHDPANLNVGGRNV